MSRISIVGSGISGLSAACFAAKEGHLVSVFEKNETIGGRMRHYSHSGFMFDIGPSWYWMPEIFETFFAHFDKTPADYYNLVKLDPGFRIFFGKQKIMDVPAEMEEIYDLFEKTEPGSHIALKKYLADAKHKYTEGMLKLAYKPSLSLLEFADIRLLMNIGKLKMFTSISKHIRRYFKDERLISLMEFPVLFLGAMPRKVPALYSLMNYAALQCGTWYPMGGMCKIIEGMHRLALSLGVKFYTNDAVEKMDVGQGKINKLITRSGKHDTDMVIATCDYHHTETLLDPGFRNYSEGYWDRKTFAPSCLIFYLGLNRKLPGLVHHNLFFDKDFAQHSREIYKQPQWPTAPLFYVCCPSVTDKSVAPPNQENLFVLMPVASGLEDNKDNHEYYYDLLMDRIEIMCGEQVKDAVIYKKTYSVNDFTADYNAYKGNAYGLANTLSQTSVLKPKMKNKHINNLFYAGQLTGPGPGIPPCLISGQIAANLAIKELKKMSNT